MKISLVFTLTICLLVNCVSYAHADTKYETIDSLLQVFDGELIKRDHYLLNKNTRIGQLRQKSARETDIRKKILVNEKLFVEFHTYIYDSALHYLNQNTVLLDLHPDHSLYMNNSLYLCNLYIMNGVFWEVEPILNGIDIERCTLSDKRRIIETEARYNFYLYKVAENQINREKYLRRFLSLENKLLENGIPMEDITPDVRFFFHFKRKEWGRITAICDSMIRVLPEESHFYHLAYDWKSVVAHEQRNIYEKTYNLVMASIYQQRNCIKNARNTYKLTHFLFEHDCINLAYKYNKIVQEDAGVSNSFIQQSRSSKLTHLITIQYEQKILNQKKKMCYYILTISILSFGLIFLVIVLIRHMRKLAAAKRIQLKLNKQLDEYNRTLLQDNTLKEEYIGIFLQLRPHYIESLNEYRKTVMRFVKEKRFSDLYEFCKSDADAKAEYEKSQKEFDKMFLHLYPEFVSQFNSLLIEEARVIPKKGSLTLEMRIYALIRLGITDSAKIARYLHYSVNTIYNYRSRIKQKANVPKDDFESMVRNIGSGSKSFR